ncbi:hypothetical protein CLOLEP_00019 [[Clostridium] leptum DSM 753]|uniref:Uncharacterized protein n=1 Tax=[Clostridium] leptum DSM 753 TaxID=428125 RepID=A7VN95_9FIRM|nr:hypothetical protein CLOLEP_00019 [[Clostridium] leptum DSM 753]
MPAGGHICFSSLSPSLSYPGAAPCLFSFLFSIAHLAAFFTVLPAFSVPFYS